MTENLKQFQVEMELRGRSPRTISLYSAWLKVFFTWLSHPADRVTLNDIKRFQRHLVYERHTAWPSYNMAVCAIRAYCRVVLRKKWSGEDIAVHRQPPALPKTVSRNEIRLMLEVCLHQPRHLAIVATLYSTGMRLSELISLKIADVDSARGHIHIQRGKGGLPRLVPLSAGLWRVLQSYYQTLENRQPEDWLFKNFLGDSHARGDSVQSLIRRLALRCGIARKVSPHVFRHSLATHLLENGTDIRSIQALLGHRSIHTTFRYLQVTTDWLCKIPNPLDGLLPKALAY